MNTISRNQEQDREARIRECAYHLWEANGKPYGRDVEFWQRARQMIAEQDEDPPAPAEPEREAVRASVGRAALRRRRPTKPRKPQPS
jgi:hypothetical protein